jgi:hypothetical protein
MTSVEVEARDREGLKPREKESHFIILQMAGLSGSRIKSSRFAIIGAAIGHEREDFASVSVV